MANNAKPTKEMFGRKARSGLEEQAAAITPDLTYQTEAQKKAIASRSDQLQQGIARRAGLEGSGLRTGMSGQNIRLMGTIGAQQLAEESAIEQRAGGEQRANLQALLGAQSMEDKRSLSERQFGLSETTGLGQLGIAKQAQALKGQESIQQYGLQKRAATEAETAGAAQRKLSEGQLTGQVSETLDKEAVLQAYMQPDGGFDWNRAIDDGIEQDPVTGEFTRKTGTISERAQTEAEAAGAEQRKLSGRQVTEAEKAGESARRLGEAQLTGELEGEEGEATTETLAKQQQDIAAESAQSAMELAERQRVDARDVKFAELGQQGTQLAETARQFDAELLQKSTEFNATYGLTAEQFKESKRQFDAGIDLENSKAQAQMNQFNAEQKLRAAELYGGDGLSKPEFLSALGTKAGDTAFRSDLDFNNDGTINDEDETIFDESAEETGVIRGRSTLAQRELEYQEARFSTEAELQSEKLGIDAQSIKNAFEVNKDKIDQSMAEFNSNFTGYLYERGPDGVVVVTNEAGEPLSSVEHETKLNALANMETSMTKTVSQLASEMGIIGPNAKYPTLDKVPDDQLYSITSLLFAGRAPGQASIGYSAPPTQQGGGGFMDSMMKVAQVAGYFI